MLEQVWILRQFDGLDERKLHDAVVTYQVSIVTLFEFAFIQVIGARDDQRSWSVCVLVNYLITLFIKERFPALGQLRFAADFFINVLR